LICLRIGKTYTAKTPSDDFKVTTPENPLLSKQTITSKRILIPYTNLQLNPYPNTQLVLFCSDNLSFSMHDSQYVTNQLCGSQYATWSLTWEECCLQSSLVHHTMKVMKLLGHKPYGVQTQQLLQEKEELEQTKFPVRLFFTLVELCSCATVRNLLWPLK